MDMDCQGRAAVSPDAASYDRREETAEEREHEADRREETATCVSARLTTARRG
jgi:hypothetical protein